MLRKSQIFKFSKRCINVSNLPETNFRVVLCSFLFGRGPAHYSDAIVAGWLYVSIYLVICISVSSSPSDLISTVITRPLCNCLVKKINQGTDVFTHKHTELPASSFSIICVLKHVRTRLIILTGGKNNHKIEIARTGTANILFYHFRKC